MPDYKEYKPLTPLELLSPIEREVPFLEKIWGTTLGTIFGLGISVGGNMFLKRPIMSGIQRHVLCTAIGIGVGRYAESCYDDRLAERDAVFRHYIELHPEDFPMPERKKWSEVLRPWNPIR